MSYYLRYPRRAFQRWRVKTGRTGRFAQRPLGRMQGPRREPINHRIKRIISQQKEPKRRDIETGADTTAV